MLHWYIYGWSHINMSGERKLGEKAFKHAAPSAWSDLQKEPKIVKVDDLRI